MKQILKKADILLIAIVALISLLSLLLQYTQRSAAVDAVIYVQGDVHTVIRLEEGKAAYTLILKTTPTLTITVAGNRIAFTHADCPDKRCVKSSWLSRAPQSAACLPAKVVIILRSNAQNLDAITY